MNAETSHRALYTKNLKVGYKQKSQIKTVVEGVTLSLTKGSLSAIIGVNGSGKSTLLRTLAGLQTSLDGAILINNKTLQSYKAYELAKNLSVVLTGKEISKNLTVAELIALGRQPYTNWLGKHTKKDKDICEKALIDTALWELRDRKCFSLSDGQLQRVLIARALAQDTKIIMLDEPTTHLDLHHKAAILKLLKDISQRLNKTILFSTHDIDLVLPLCDKIIVLKEQQAIIDTPQALIQQDVFNSLFPKEAIGFNKQTQRFYLKNNPAK